MLPERPERFLGDGESTEVGGAEAAPVEGGGRGGAEPAEADDGAPAM